MSDRPTRLPSAVRRAADRVPAVRALGGSKSLERSADAARRASDEHGGPVRLAAELMRDLPAVARLVYRLARDPRTGWRRRIALLGLALYLVSPVDPIPDWIPVIGAADDIVLVITTLRWVLRTVPIDVLREHWDGEPVILELLSGRERPSASTRGPI